LTRGFAGIAKGLVLLSILILKPSFGWADPVTNFSVCFWGTMEAAVVASKRMPRGQAGILARDISKSYHIAQKLFRFSAVQNANFKDFQQNRNPNSEVVVLQMGGVKSLRESIWNPVGAELSLENQFLVLHEYLQKNPQYGRILGNSYKDLYIETELSAQRFDALVVRELKRKWMEFLETNNKGFSSPRDSYWNQQFRVERGYTIADASFRLGLSQTRYRSRVTDISYEQWMVRARKTRAELIEKSKEAGLSLSEIILKMREYLGRDKVSVEKLRKWLERKKLTAEAQAELLELILFYYDDLQVVDVVPLEGLDRHPSTLEDLLHHRQKYFFGSFRTTWAVERRIFGINAIETDFVFAGDLANFGAYGLIMQDRFIARSSRLEELPDVYRDSKQKIEEYAVAVYRDLKKELGEGVEIYFYGSGDELAFAFKGMTSEQAIKTQQLFSTYRYRQPRGFSDPSFEFLMYSSPLTRVEEKYDPISLAQALVEAQNSIHKD
jgi:hypothetical protein